MERTLRVEVKGTRAAKISVNRKMLKDIFKDQGVLAVWTMENQNLWFVTFDEFDGQTLNSKSVGLILCFSACDRIVVKARIH